LNSNRRNAMLVIIDDVVVDGGWQRTRCGFICCVNSITMCWIAS
jgi:hypothetical protein